MGLALYRPREEVCEFIPIPRSTAWGDPNDIQLTTGTASRLTYGITIGADLPWLFHGGLKMENKTEVWQGTLALMVLKTLETLGPLHGYGIARRIEQISGNRLMLNYGTLYPVLLRLEQEGSIVSRWGVSENNRKAKYYRLTRSGRREIQRAVRDWEEATAILACFLRPSGGLT